MDEELLNGYSGTEKEQLADLLQRLLPCLDLNNIYFCGGIAIRYHLVSNQKVARTAPSSDLNFCAETLDAVLPKIKGHFEVVDLQHLKEGYTFFLKLFDEVQRININVFDNSFPTREPIYLQFENWLVKIRNLEDQLVKTVFDMQEVLSKKPTQISSKQFEDGWLLWEIANQEKAQNYWQESVQNNPLFKGLPKNIKDAMIQAELFIQKHPTAS